MQQPTSRSLTRPRILAQRRTTSLSRYLGAHRWLSIIASLLLVAEVIVATLLSRSSASPVYARGSGNNEGPTLMA